MKKFVYGNTPGMLKQEISEDPQSYAGKDAVFMGIPWEGGVTWNAYAGTELLPKAIRNASARYTGYLPELDDINIWDNIVAIDGGDLGCEPSDTLKTFDKITEKAKELFSSGTVPIFLGGDHSITFPIMRGLGKSSRGRWASSIWTRTSTTGKPMGMTRMPAAARCTALRSFRA